jgi:hypothetical protein
MKEQFQQVHRGSRWNFRRRKRVDKEQRKCLFYLTAVSEYFLIPLVPGDEKEGRKQ